MILFLQMVLTAFGLITVAYVGYTNGVIDGYTAVTDPDKPSCWWAKRFIEKHFKNKDVCGLCGKVGTDRVVGDHIYWPGERRPHTKYVHSECQKLAQEEAMSKLSEDEKDKFLRSI